MLSDREIQTMFFDKSKGIPARRDIVRQDAVRSILLKDSTLKGNEIGTETLINSINDAMHFPGFRQYGRAVSFIDKEIENIPGNTEQLRNFLSQLNIRINEFLQY